MYIHRLSARCTYIPFCVMVVWYDEDNFATRTDYMPSRSPDSYVTVHFRGMLMRITVQSNSGSDSFPAIRRWTFDRSNLHLVRPPHLSANSHTPENRSWMGVLSMVPCTSSFHTERVGPRLFLVDGVDIVGTCGCKMGGALLLITSAHYSPPNAAPRVVFLKKYD